MGNLEVNQAVENYKMSVQAIKNLAHKQYTPENCPLAGRDHDDYAEAIWGLGQYE